MRSRGTALIIVLLSAVITFGQQNQPEPDKIAFSLTRTLSFDRNLESRAADTMRIAIVYAQGGKTRAELLRRAFMKDDDTINDIPLDAVPVQFSSVQELLALVDRLHIDAIYIDASARMALSSILQVTRARNIPSLGASFEFVASGVSIGVYESENELHIIVNPRANRIEGLHFEPEFFFVAERYEG